MLEIFQVRWFLAEKSPSLEIGSIYRNCRPSGISFAGKERVTDGAVGREIAQPPWSIHVGWKGGTVRWLTRWFSRFSRLQSPSPWGNFQIKLLNLKRETWAACSMWWQRRPSSMCSLVDSSPRGPPEYLNIAHSHCQPRHTAAVSMYFSTDWPVKKLQILFKCIIPFLKACCSQHLHLKAQRTHPCTCTQPRVLTRHTHPREHGNYKTPCISSVGNSALQGDTCADSETIMKVIELWDVLLLCSMALIDSGD